MRKFIFIAMMSVILTACGSYKSLDLSQLTTGMTKQQVQATIGPPDRVLAVNDKEEGYQEVLEYRTARDEVYALEFWNDYLTGYEFLYDDVTYVPSYTPPVVWPDYGRPIYIIQGDNRPNRPNRPSQPSRPGRPGESGRPGGSTSRPPTNTGRPNNDKSDLTRPVPIERPSTRPSTSGSSSGRESTTTTGTPDRSSLRR